jgi:hypothetical protein
MRVSAMRHRAWFAWRSPLRLSRWRVTFPEDAEQLRGGGAHEFAEQHVELGHLSVESEHAATEDSQRRLRGEGDRVGSGPGSQRRRLGGEPGA